MDSTSLGHALESLNLDPYNIRAEELALEECTLGAEVRRTWSEREMVCSFDGRHFPGTPDGMFETWDGALTCVQVVRVPLLAEFDLSALKEALAQTVLTKVVKSQHWLSASHIVPQDFVIFCWLPFAIPEDVSEHAETLMQRVQKLDPRFSLRLRVPAQAGALFPALFASSARERRRVTESDVSTYTGSEESDDEELLPWDITWGWDHDWEDPSVEMPEEAASEGAGESSSDDEMVGEVTWDVTWSPEPVDVPGGEEQISAYDAPALCTGGEFIGGVFGEGLYIQEVQQEDSVIWDDWG